MKNKITILEAYPIEIEIKISLVGNQFETLQNEFRNNFNLLHSFNLKKQSECVYFLNIITDISCLEDIKQILYKITDLKQNDNFN